MFEQHPVPQQISSYQFRLVGDMTLKQFFQVAGGAVVALLLYASPFPPIFKWPLIVLSVLAGAAFAFLPLQERPLEQWVSAFIRSIYGPTIFVWQSSQKAVPYFAPEEGGQPIATQGPSSGVSINDVHTANLEASEQTMLAKISGLFSLTPKKGPVEVSPALAQTVSAPPSLATQVSPVSVPRMSQPAQINPNIQSVILSENRTINQPMQFPTPVRPAVATPQAPAITLQNKHGFVTVDPKTMQVPQVGGSHLSQTFVPGQMQQGTSAQFSDQAAPPSPPTTPNIIVGQIMDSQGKIVEGAIMEIKDQLGRPVRALKTNRAGHFMIVTPLPSGQYTMFVEKDGLTFEPVTFVASGTIISPIAIKAQVN